MRVLWLIQRDTEHPASGGGARTAFEVTRRLVRRGHEVRLVTSGWPGAPSHANLDGVHLRRFPSYILPHLVLPFVLRSEPIPNVVVDDLAHPFPWASPLVSGLSGTVFFRHLHNRTLPGQVGRVAANVLSKSESAYGRIYTHWPFVTETEGSVRDLATLGISEGRCRVIHPGVDLDLFRPGETSPTPRLVYFGGMRGYKRPSHALLALVRLLASGVDAELTVIGDGPVLASVRDLCARLALGSKVRFLGRLAVEDLARVVGSSWVNLHCSVAEGWGLTTVEAAACGVPTVAYRVPGVSESVREGSTGILVDDGEPAQMAEAIARVLPEIDRWRVRCRRYAETLSWEKSVDAWESHLTSLVG